MTGRLALFRGADPGLLGDAVGTAVDAALGGSERSEVLDDYRGEDYQPGDVAMSCGTVSMFGDRVVVARDLQRFGTDDLAPLLAAIATLADDVSLILVWEGSGPGSRRKSDPLTTLAEAVTAAGGTVTVCDPPKGKGATAWVGEQIAASGITLTRRSESELVGRLGDDVARVRDVLAQLRAVFGAGAGPLDVEEIEPFLGEAGGVPPWELTDAIDRGDVPTAVGNVRRMVGGGGRHPLQVLATLQSHFEKLARLEGSGARDERAAAALLGLKGSTFPAKKALASAQRLGSTGIRRGLRLVAAADVDLRGRTAQPAESVLEVLVARLAAHRR